MERFSWLMKQLLFPWDKSKLEAIEAEAHVKEKSVSEGIILKHLKKVSETVKDESAILQKFENSEEKKELEETSDVEAKVRPKEKLNEFETCKIRQASDTSAKCVITARIVVFDFHNEWCPAEIVEPDFAENLVLV